MKKTVALTQYSIEEIFNIRKPTLSLGVYKDTCQFLISYNKKKHISVHCFLTLEWYLMDQDDTCVCVHVSHIGWRDDCTIFTFYHLKGYHEGVNQNDPCHIDSNPLFTEMCPVIALAK